MGLSKRKHGILPLDTLPNKSAKFYHLHTPDVVETEPLPEESDLLGSTDIFEDVSSGRSQVVSVFSVFPSTNLTRHPGCLNKACEFYARHPEGNPSSNPFTGGQQFCWRALPSLLLYGHSCDR